MNLLRLWDWLHHLTFSVIGATSTKEIEDNISQYIEPINKLMQLSEK